MWVTISLVLGGWAFPLVNRVFPITVLYPIWTHNTFDIYFQWWRIVWTKPLYLFKEGLTVLDLCSERSNIVETRKECLSFINVFGSRMGGIASGSREPNHISQKGIIYKIHVYNWVGGIYRVIPARLIININIASIEWRADAATFTSTNNLNRMFSHINFKI